MMAWNVAKRSGYQLLVHATGADAAGEGRPGVDARPRQRRGGDGYRTTRYLTCVTAGEATTLTGISFTRHAS